MPRSSSRRDVKHVPSFCQLLLPALFLGTLVQAANSGNVQRVKGTPGHELPFHLGRIRSPNREPPRDSDTPIPLVITNKCDSTIWPGIATQHGKGPGVGGFELAKGRSKELWVGPDWQGRVWGRTNCTVNGESCSCQTGDCMGKLDCEFSGATPATLAEFTLAGGLHHDQTFYDLSLVDGYNLPMGINYIPAKNTTFIPPNLTNCACIASPSWIYSSNETGTYYSNSSFPVPLETQADNNFAARWCPWKYLAFPPTKPGDGIYPYPDDDIQRPEFSPCNSACAATGSDKECCEGKYHDPDVCQPSDYSKKAKQMCPDAYSFAFDDQKSTFIIPSGGGWEVVLCPKGRSTNILRQLGEELSELGHSGKLSDLAQKRLRDITYITSDRSAATTAVPAMQMLKMSVLIIGAWLLV